jgi:hypothetical protein
LTLRAAKAPSRRKAARIRRKGSIVYRKGPFILTQRHRDTKET